MNTTARPLSASRAPGLGGLRRPIALIALLCLGLGFLLDPRNVLAQDGPAAAPAAAPASPAPPAHPAAKPAPAAKAVPAGRAARNVAIITIHGPIDEWTSYGVKQRINRAVADGADAVVFDIDTPGGELGACLHICDAIKACPIPNTVAWINPTAYSAGSIIAIACREIVVNDPSTFGDAMPIIADPLMGLQTLPEAEREKMLGPLLAEVVDSARRNGYDEMLVQGLVRRGVELWLVENVKTGQRLFVTADQYKLAVGTEPTRSTPQVPSVTGKAGGSAPAPSVGPGSIGTGPVSEAPNAYQPAAPQMSKDLAREVDAALEIKGSRTQRPDLRAPEHAGQYREVSYISDGQGLVTLKSDAMRGYGIATDVIHNDNELKAYFGAASTARLNPSWSVGLVRFLRNPIVMGLLLVVFLLAMFIEMTHPGVILPGAIAATCLVALVLPPLLIDLAAWWSVGAIVLGIVCLAVEIFLIPGFGVFGVLGIILLFGGLIGIFVGGPSGLFPSTPRGRDDLAYGAATVLISTITSLILMYFVGKHLPGLPVVNRLVLKHQSGDDAADGEGLLAAMAGDDGPIRPGQTGRTLTPLRPAGRVQIGDQIVDVVADMGFIDIDQPVRVVSVDRFRTVVEKV
jgi:membrane-bound ClpP family serine protease